MLVHVLKGVNLRKKSGNCKECSKSNIKRSVQTKANDYLTLNGMFLSHADMKCHMVST